MFGSYPAHQATHFSDHSGAEFKVVAWHPDSVMQLATASSADSRPVVQVIIICVIFFFFLFSFAK
jgi:hypothetical protein